MRITSLTGLALGLLLATPLMAQTPQPSTTTKPAAPPSSMMAPARPAATTAPAAATATHQELIDINSATVKQLRELPGIGEARADAIVKGRPYKGKDELTEKKIVPQNVYAGIKDKIIARQK